MFHIYFSLANTKGMNKVIAKKKLILTGQKVAEDSQSPSKPTTRLIIILISKRTHLFSFLGIRIQVCSNLTHGAF